MPQTIFGRFWNNRTFVRFAQFFYICAFLYIDFFGVFWYNKIVFILVQSCRCERRKKAQGNAVYLQEGANSLQVTVSYLANAEFDKYKFFADYIRFIPTKGTEITAAGVTIEAENMTTQNIETITGASNDKWVGHRISTQDIDPLQALVTFPESQYYDLTYVSSKYIASVSEISLYLDATKLGSNKDDDAIKTDVQERYTGSETNVGWTKQWCHMHEYTKRVWIDAGTYRLNVQVAQCVGEAAAKYFVDCIKFKPSEDFVLKGDANDYTACVGFESPVSGAALMAAYNGNELVAISAKIPLNAVQYVGPTISTDELITKIKVFVWDGTGNCIPQCPCKELTVTE